MKDTFTMEQALAIQEQHLKQWDSILKPEIAARLRALVTATNATVKTPYEVCRGSGIDRFVHNPGDYLLI